MSGAMLNRPVYLWRQEPRVKWELVSWKTAFQRGNPPSEGDLSMRLVPSSRSDVAGPTHAAAGR